MGFAFSKSTLEGLVSASIISGSVISVFRGGAILAISLCSTLIRVLMTLHNQIEAYHKIRQSQLLMVDNVMAGG